MLKIIIKENKEKLNNTAEYNLNYILQNNWEVGRFPGKTMSIMQSFNNDRQVAETIVREIPQFSQYKISRAITGASMGRIFLLSGSDHVLKVFSESLNTKEDMRWYKHCESKLHSGKAKITTLPVYDSGEIKAPNGRPIYYVEMARFMSIQEYFDHDALDRKTVPKDSDSLTQDFAKIRESYVAYYYEVLKTHLDWFLKRDGKAIANDLIKSGLMKVLFEFSKIQAKSLIETIHHLMQDGFKPKDFVMRNVGVLEQTSRSKSPTFIIFDN